MRNSDSGEKTGLGLLLLISLLAVHSARSAPAPARPPNFVIIFADDLGYGDIGCYGARDVRTPNVDRLAREGMRFTSFYVSQAVCSASRAALLTGCLPNRIGILGALGPNSKTGIADTETTLAELLKTRGYATAIFGKWHLGDNPQFLPTRHGFDQYFGLPYSNDMWPQHPSNPKGYPPLPLIEGDRTIQVMPDQTRLTKWYTEHAVEFIARNRDRPFFLYVPHSMPHVPLHVSAKFRGRNPRGLYGNVLEEIDWSVGQILRALKKHRIDKDTLVVFTSDNGPWLLYGNHGGSAGPLREGKGTTFEGGVRVPFVARWPGHVPRGATCSELAGTIDLFPTLARLAGAAPAAERRIDGLDIWPLLAGQHGARTPHAAWFYYWDRHLQAVRSGPWKLHFPHAYVKPAPAGRDSRPGQYANPRIGLELFNLDNDLGEATNVAAQHPDVVQHLENLAEGCRTDLGDSATKVEGRNVRPPGRRLDPP